MWLGTLRVCADGWTALDGAGGLHGGPQRCEAVRAVALRVSEAGVPGMLRVLRCHQGSMAIQSGRKNSSFWKNADGLNVHRETGGTDMAMSYGCLTAGFTVGHRTGCGPRCGLGSRTHSLASPQHHNFRTSPASGLCYWSIGPSEPALCVLRAELSVFPLKEHHM